MAIGFSIQIREDDFEIAGKLPQHLAARAARRCRCIRRRDDHNTPECLMAFGQRLVHRDTFGSDGKPIGRVLDVAPRDDRPVLGLE